MNDKVTKRIRAKVYKEGSRRNENRYKRVNDGGTLVCFGKRAEYRREKKRR